jgi:hypothetical protein
VTGQPVIRLVLTTEQREEVKRRAGHDVEAIDLSVEDVKEARGALHFRWRLSTATGIPRRAWTKDDEKVASPDDPKERQP